MHGSLPVRYLGDIPLVKLAIAVDPCESDSRRSGCRNQKSYRKAIPYEIDSLASSQPGQYRSRRAARCRWKFYVLDHKKAHDESGCRQSEQQAKPVAGVEDSPHQNPKKDERYNRDNELKDAARAARLAIASKYPCPRARIKCGRNIWLSLTHPATPTRRLADQRRGIASDRKSDTLECVVPPHSPWDEVST